jgi:hypothetical protein
MPFSLPARYLESTTGHNLDHAPQARPRPANSTTGHKLDHQSNAMQRWGAAWILVALYPTGDSERGHKQISRGLRIFRSTRLGPFWVRGAQNGLHCGPRSGRVGDAALSCCRAGDAGSGPSGGDMPRVIPYLLIQLPLKGPASKPTPIPTPRFSLTAHTR